LQQGSPTSVVVVLLRSQIRRWWAFH